MQTSDWIALGALVVSVLALTFTWWQHRSNERRADVTAYLHWLPNKAPITTHQGDVVWVGYHLIVYNRGPRAAEDIGIRVFRGGAGRDEDLRLTDLGREELPIPFLDVGARYPIPWALGEDGREFADDRRFEIQLTWRDGRGNHDRVVPLRRGHIGS